MAAVITATGTFTAINDAPTEEGQSIHQGPYGQDELRVRDGLDRDQESIQEVNNVVALFSEAWGSPPPATIVRLKDILGQMQRQRTDGSERVYSP